MWLIPYNKGENHYIYIDFKKKRDVWAIKFYNYNKSPEDTFWGSKTIWIKADGKFLTPKRGLVIKKPIGLTFNWLDQSHLISLPFNDGWSDQQISKYKI